jgi:large subunit ribosomal protein L23
MINKLIIKKPIITEKSLNDATRGIFTFEADRSSSKLQIKKAIEETFAVHVKKISTVIMKGKKRMVGRKRQKVQEANKKRARVKLAAGEKIDLFEVGKNA